MRFDHFDAEISAEELAADYYQGDTHCAECGHHLADCACSGYGFEDTSAVPADTDASVFANVLDELVNVWG
jgi:hypothetical protein